MIAFITNLVDNDYIKRLGNGLGFALALFCILAYIVTMMVAIVGHELGHGLVALWNGDKTAKFMGRLSPNPVKHFDLIGFAMMLLVGFGWAKPVPIDPRNFKNYKKGMVLTSLAGVTYNLILAILGTLCLAILVKCVWNVPLIEMSDAQIGLIYFLQTLFQLTIAFNVALMVFNLLPIYPLDGFRVIETLAKPDNKYVNFMYKHGSKVMLALLLVCFVIGRFIPQVNIISNMMSLASKGLGRLFELIFGLPAGVLLG